MKNILLLTLLAFSLVACTFEMPESAPQRFISFRRRRFNCESAVRTGVRPCLFSRGNAELRRTQRQGFGGRFLGHLVQTLY